MKLMTTSEVNERLLHIIDMQWSLIKDLMKALGPFEAYEKRLRRIAKAKEEVGI